MAGDTLKELWAVASGAGPVDVRVFVLLTSNFRYGIGDVPKMLLSDVPLAGIVVQNLGTIPIELGPDRSLKYGEGVQVPPRSQWTAGGVSSIGAASGDASVARPLYYDRDPQGVTRLYTINALAPDPGTIRWTYTVPSERKTFLQSVMAMIMRKTVAAPPGDAYNYIEFAIFGGASTFIAIAEEEQNVVGAQKIVTFAGVGLMRAGDVLNNLTSDSSTGGTYTMRSGAWLVEFDE